MKELNMNEIELVSGAMEQRTSAIIAACFVVSPVLGVGALVGYYINKE